MTAIDSSKYLRASKSVICRYTTSDLPLWYLQAYLIRGKIYKNMYISSSKQMVVNEDEKNNREIQKVKQKFRFIDSLKYTKPSKT